MAIWVGLSWVDFFFICTSVSLCWLGSLTHLRSAGRLAGAGWLRVVSAVMTGVSLHMVAQVFVRIVIWRSNTSKVASLNVTFQVSLRIMFAGVSLAKASQELAQIQ